MKNKHNLYPVPDWTNEELIQEIHEVEKELKKQADYAVLYVLTSNPETSKESWERFDKAKGKSDKHIRAEWRSSDTLGELLEKEQRFIKSYMNFRNRELKENLDKKARTSMITRELFQCKSLVKDLKQIYNLYGVQSKSEKSKDRKEKGQGYENAFFSAACICFKTNYSRMPGEMIKHFDDRAGQLNECMDYAITKRCKKYQWSDYAMAKQIKMSEMNISLMEVHMSDIMRSHPDYLSCIRNNPI